MPGVSFEGADSLQGGWTNTLIDHTYTTDHTKEPAEWFVAARVLCAGIFALQGLEHEQLKQMELHEKATRNSTMHVETPTCRDEEIWTSSIPDHDGSRRHDRFIIFFNKANTFLDLNWWILCVVIQHLWKVHLELVLSGLQVTIVILYSQRKLSELLVILS